MFHALLVSFCLVSSVFVCVCSWPGANETRSTVNNQTLNKELSAATATAVATTNSANPVAIHSLPSVELLFRPISDRHVSQE